MAILCDLLAGIREAKHQAWDGRVQTAHGQTELKQQLDSSHSWVGVGGMINIKHTVVKEKAAYSFYCFAFYLSTLHICMYCT